VSLIGLAFILLLIGNRPILRLMAGVH